MKLRSEKESEDFSYSNKVIRCKKTLENDYKIKWKPSFAIPNLQITLYKKKRVPLISKGWFLTLLILPFTIITTLLSFIVVFVGKYALSGANFVRKERLNRFDRTFNWFTLTLFIALILTVILPRIW